MPQLVTASTASIRRIRDGLSMPAERLAGRTVKARRAVDGQVRGIYISRGLLPAAIAVIAFASSAAVMGHRAGVAPAATLPRVASTSLCGDQYLLRLADRSQIASVSRQAAGPLAFHAREAAGLPRNQLQIEQMVAQDVDIVLVEPGADQAFVRGLQQLGIRVVELPRSDTHGLGKLADAVRRIAAELGHADRAEPIVADMMQRAAALAARRPDPDLRPLVAYFRPDGGGSGADTFVDLTFTLAGLRNLQALAGQTGWARMSLEDVVQTPPEAFVISFFDTQRDSLAAARGRNPLLGRFNAPVMMAPGKMWVCASPAIIDVAEYLAAERRRLFPDREPW